MLSDLSPAHMSDAQRMAALAALRLPSGTRTFGTCAVVGSSGSLLHDRFGPQIDAHDVVLRFNNAPVSGFEGIAGSRTSVRLVNSHAAAAALQRCADFTAGSACPTSGNSSERCCPREPVLLNSGRPRIAECYRKLCDASAVNVKTLLQNTSLVRAFERMVAPQTLVSGVFGLATALLLCTKQIDLYGMTQPSQSNPTPRGARNTLRYRYHYYDQCGHFDSDAIGAAASGLLALRPVLPAQFRVVPPTGAYASWVPTTDSLADRFASHAANALTTLAPSRSTSPPLVGTLQPCANRNGVRQVNALLKKAAATNLSVPCCMDTWPEPGRLGRCSSYADRGACEQWKALCPVACERCRICPGSKALPTYQQIFARMKLPPLPEWYSSLSTVPPQQHRDAALGKALKSAKVFATRDSLGREAINTARRWPSPVDVVGRLRARKLPYVVVDGYWNASRTRAARAEALVALAGCSEVNEDGGDQRRLGLSERHARLFPLAVEFAEDSYLRQVAATFLRTSFNTRVQAGLTRAGQASGGGWHRDTRRPGIKAMVYLDDVGPKNGPFAMLLGYNEQRLEHSHDALSKRTTRFNASVVEGEVRLGAAVHPIHAAAGALIIFEISSVHRGMPCEGGERAVLTNYYRVKRPSTTCPVHA